MTDEAGDIFVTGRTRQRDPNDLTLIVGDYAISGWTSVEVTLRAEGFPNSFRISLSSRAPLTGSAVVAYAGQPCIVLLGNDQVIVGYIDRDTSTVAAGHELAIIGRGRTQDLVDCSSEWPSGQMIEGTVLDIAKRLALPYVIGVELGEGAEAGPQVPRLCHAYEDRPADIIQRCARNAGLLAYENGEGKLILAKVGAKKAASAIVLGGNVQACAVENAMDGRYSTIVCCRESLDALSDLPGSDFFAPADDPNVPRHRQLNIVLEQAENPIEFTAKKAAWEAARRAGRSTLVRVTLDSWRDANGDLWMPNTLVDVDVPGLRLPNKTLAIVEATFLRNDETGTTADLVLMPPDGLAPEPISLQPTPAADVVGPDGAA